MKISSPHSFNLASFSPFPILTYRPLSLSLSFNVFNGGSSILRCFSRLFQVSFFSIFLFYNHIIIFLFNIVWQFEWFVNLTFHLSQQPSLICRDFVSLFFFSNSVAIRFCFWLLVRFCIALIFEVVRWIIKFELFVVLTWFEVSIF